MLLAQAIVGLVLAVVQLAGFCMLSRMPRNPKSQVPTLLILLTLVPLPLLPTLLVPCQL
jgi:hypothetical protein